MVGVVREAKNVAKVKAASETGRRVCTGAVCPVARRGARRRLRARWFRVCGAVLVLLAVAGLVALMAAPLLLALTR
ncbi:hypothetical protein ACQEU6_39980 [Spirillospora sp. CA-108201]